MVRESGKYFYCLARKAYKNSYDSQTNTWTKENFDVGIALPVYFTRFSFVDDRSFSSKIELMQQSVRMSVCLSVHPSVDPSPPGRVAPFIDHAPLQFVPAAAKSYTHVLLYLHKHSHRYVRVGRIYELADLFLWPCAVAVQYTWNKRKTLRSIEMTFHSGSCMAGKEAVVGGYQQVVILPPGNGGGGGFNALTSWNPVVQKRNAWRSRQEFRFRQSAMARGDPSSSSPIWCVLASQGDLWHMSVKLEHDQQISNTGYST